MYEAHTPTSDAGALPWDDLPFDTQAVLSDIPQGSKTSALHVSVVPTPRNGSIVVRGVLANGQRGSVRLDGTIYAARLPFATPVLHIQYLGQTRSVELNLESYVLA